uniref:RNA-directed RNA polymerase L n=1 Tax=Rhizoctonia solani bunya/phlebo-like virus 1 TaxID=2600106 RepID=A0A5B8HBV7_9VIRU|nr:RNA-dependent RNA polymerase [Rhizoctonia solani bunya/phlebo-like virus 1]
MRYHGMMSERNHYRYILQRGFNLYFPTGQVDLDTLDKYLEETNNVYKIVDDTYTEMYKGIREFKANIASKSFASAAQTVESMMEGRVNRRILDFWYRSRHDIFASKVLTYFGRDSEANMDVDMVAAYNYVGPGSNKTPDYSFEMDDGTLVLIDFAVTGSDPGMVREKKMEKYETLRSGLSNHLNRRVIFEGVVWKITGNNEFQLPSFLESIREDLEHDEELKETSSFQFSLTMQEGYEMAKKELESGQDDDRVTQSKILAMDNLTNSLLKMNNIGGKMTYDPCEMRRKFRGGDKKKINSNEIYNLEQDNMEEIEMKRFYDMEMFTDLEESSKLNDKAYITKVKNVMRNYISEGRLPKDLETVKTVFDESEDKLNKVYEGEVYRNKMIRERFNNNENFSFSKAFKLPFPLSEQFRNMKDSSTADFEYLFEYEAKLELEDGTKILGRTPMYDFDKNKEVLEYNEEGMGFDMEQDTMFCENLIEFLSEEIKETDKFGEYEKDFNSLKWYEEVSKTQSYFISMFWREMIENISYLDGRRYVNSKREGNTVLKDFGNYILMVKKGSKLTSQKQINFKLILRKECAMMDEASAFHKFYPIKGNCNEGFVTTRWLALSITDIRHFLKLPETMLLLSSDYQDKKQEMYKNTVAEFRVLDKSLITMFMILMEHKRGTSTTNQLNRYIMHSATSFISNREKMIMDINADPIRSRIESYMRICQMRWFMHVLEKSKQMNFLRVSNLDSTKTNYDRVIMPSFYDLSNNIEFSMMMNEIYTSNLFDKEAGFKDHRIKAIVAKMSVAEIHYQEVKEKDWSKGKVDNLEDFFDSKDELHQFDKNYVIAATKRYFRKDNNRLLFKEAILRALQSCVDSAMMMTSSLKAGPYSSEALEFNERINKSKSFLTIFEEVEKLNTNILMHMVSKEEVVDAIFTLFPKAQIGGPREILIQSVKLRLSVKFLETIAKMFSTTNPKEMLTKDSAKSNIQGEKMSEYKEMLGAFRKKRIPSLYCSLNADATKWAPGFVMEHFLHFIYNWEIEDEIKDFLCVVVSSFSNKKMLVPGELMKKWESKDINSKEYSEGVEWFKRQALSNQGVVELESGMGQGMLHFLSSIYHCVIDDMSDLIMRDCLLSVNGTRMDSTSLISSDDKTKMLLMWFPNEANAVKSLKDYIVMIHSLYRLGNIHTNWKKSALHFIITEFNSLFSIGKRMVWALIKDIYTALNLPDLTAPEEAVRFMLANIRRLLENGMFLPSVETALKLARKMLMRYYRMDSRLVEELKLILECDYEDLPFHLGFMPLKMPVETLIYGPEIQMYSSTVGEKLLSFYKGIYTASSGDREKVAKGAIPFSESNTGKYWLELNSHLDKELVKIKENFFKNMLKMDNEEVMRLMDSHALNVNRPIQDYQSYKQFTREYFVGMNRKYEFQETMVVHSLVRALQLSKTKGVMFPKNKEFIELEDELSKLQKDMLQDPIHRQEFMLKLMVLKDNIDDSLYDLKRFTLEMMSYSEKVSSIKMFDGLEQVVEFHEINMKKIENMRRTNKFGHPNFRTIRFYVSDVGISTKVKDILNYMFDPSQDISNSVMASFENLARMVGDKFSVDDALNKPFMFIKELMKHSDYPFKSFKDFLNYHTKNLKHVKIDMMMDVPCAGNMERNLLNVYRTKLYPSFILENVVDEPRDMSDTIFLTKMSMSEFKALDYSKIMPEDFTVSLMDSSVTRARKISQISYDKNTPFSHIEYKRVEYKSFKVDGMQYKQWTDLNFFVTAMEIKEEKTVIIHSYKDEKGDEREFYTKESSALIYTILRYMREMQDKNFRIQVQTKDYKLSKYENFMYNKMNMSFTIYTDFSMSEFKIWMQVEVDNRVANSISTISKFHMLTDNYTMSREAFNDTTFEYMGEEVPIRSMFDDPPSIEMLDEMLINKGWMREEVLIKPKERRNKKKEMKKDIDDLLKSMRTLNVSSLMKSAYKLSDIKESLDSNGSDSDSDVGSVLSYLTGDLDMTPKGKKFDKKKIFSTHKVTDEGLDFSSGMMASQHLFSDIMDALTKHDNEDEDLADSRVHERVSMIKSLDHLIQSVIPKDIEIDFHRLKRQHKQYEKEGDISKFHNYLILSIRAAMENRLSDGMVLYVYCFIFKRSSLMSKINMSSDLFKIELTEFEIKRLNELNPIRRIREISEHDKKHMSFVDRLMSKGVEDEDGSSSEYEEPTKKMNKTEMSVGVMKELESEMKPSENPFYNARNRTNFDSDTTNKKKQKKKNDKRKEKKTSNMHIVHKPNNNNNKNEWTWERDTDKKNTYSSDEEYYKNKPIFGSSNARKDKKREISVKGSVSGIPIFENPFSKLQTSEEAEVESMEFNNMDKKDIPHSKESSSSSGKTVKPKKKSSDSKNKVEEEKIDWEKEKKLQEELGESGMLAEIMIFDKKFRSSLNLEMLDKDEEDELLFDEEGFPLLDNFKGDVRLMFRDTSDLADIEQKKEMHENGKGKKKMTEQQLRILYCKWDELTEEERKREMSKAKTRMAVAKMKRDKLKEKAGI